MTLNKAVEFYSYLLMIMDHYGYDHQVYEKLPEEVDLLKACWYMNSFFKAYSVLKDIEDGYLSLVETRLSMMRFSENTLIRHASQQPNALQFFNALFIDCIARLVLLGVSLDEIFENIKYNETAYKRLFKQGVPERL